MNDMEPVGEISLVNPCPASAGDNENMEETMEHLLINSNPKYYMDTYQTCFAAVDNAHGGNTYRGQVIGKCKIGDRDGYKFEYLSQDIAGRRVVAHIPAINLFLTMDEVNKARQKDRSVQEQAVREICSTPEKLIAFLLSRAGLPDREQDIVLEQARGMRLIPEVSNE